jgi:hypothetical protein
MFPLLAHAGTLKRHWGEIDGMRVSNGTVVGKDGKRYRGRLAVSPTGVIVEQHGVYGHWLTTPALPEIPKNGIARILVRHRYRLTADEQSDLWWYICADWKAIFYPKLSNLFPIAILAHAGFTAWGIVYTPVAGIGALSRPPASDTIEILDDAPEARIN